MSFSLNPQILKDWRSTLTVAFSAIRRVKFIVEETFAFGDFDPQINWNGMTVTAVDIKRTRYLKIWKFLFVSVHINSTLAAPFSTNVMINIPGTLAGADLTVRQEELGYIQNAGVVEAGILLAQGTTDRISVFRPAFAAYTAGAFSARFNKFYEVI